MLKVRFSIPLETGHGLCKKLVVLPKFRAFSKLCRRQKTLPIIGPSRGSAGLLLLLVGGTRIAARNADAVTPPRKTATLRNQSREGKDGKRSPVLKIPWSRSVRRLTDWLPPPKPRQNKVRRVKLQERPLRATSTGWLQKFNSGRRSSAASRLLASRELLKYGASN